MRSIIFLFSLIISTATLAAEYTSKTSADARFGESMSSNGFKTVFGARREDGEGAVFIYSRTFGTWGQDVRLDAPNDRGQGFGGSVAISPDGERIALNWRPDSAIDQQQLRVYRASGSQDEYVVEQVLTNPDRPASDGFGNAGLALSNDLLVIGDTVCNDFRGCAYVYRWSGSRWSFEGKLGDSLGLETGDAFGSERGIATDGTRIIVGAWLADSTSNNQSDGKVFIYEKIGSTWQVTETLIGDDNDHLGRSVAISGSTALVGATNVDSRGVAYVYGLNSGRWTRQATLTGTDTEEGDGFGYDVALSGAPTQLIALVGAPFEDHSSKVDNGAAYVFTRSGSTWSERRKFHPTRIEHADEFGSSVEIRRDGSVVIATVAAPLDDVTETDQGAAYVFESTDGGATWRAPLLVLGADPPTIAPIANASVLEDSSVLRTVQVADGDTPVGSLVLGATASNGEVLPPAALRFSAGGAERSLTIQPSPNRSGADIEVTVSATDGLAVGTDVFAVDVVPVNDKPSVSLATELLLHERAVGDFAMENFATFNAGPFESDQVVDSYQVRILSNPNAIFSGTPPRVTPSGRLTYGLGGREGEALIGISVKDDGGTQDGGIDISDEKRLTIRNVATRDEVFVSGFERIDP